MKNGNYGLLLAAMLFAQSSSISGHECEEDEIYDVTHYAELPWTPEAPE